VPRVAAVCGGDDLETHVAELDIDSVSARSFICFLVLAGARVPGVLVRRCRSLKVAQCFV
jgi:hypothetical protein